MIVLKPQDVYHKIQLLRLLTEIADHPLLSLQLYFKGGTAASMLGFLDRFSVDLDFDLAQKADKTLLKKELEKVFAELDLTVYQQSQNTLTFLLKYQSPTGSRNTLKWNALPILARSNRYQPQYLAEIDRSLICQTIETMFANKLVIPLNRYQKYHSVAGRDFYDLHHFFLKGYAYEPKIIKERTKLSLPEFFKTLIEFTEKNVTERLVNEDLNTLLPQDKYVKIKRTLKTEVLSMLQNELARLKPGKISAIIL